MTQFTTYGEEFPPRFAGKTVEVEFKTLPGEAAAFLREQKRKDNFLQAHLGILGLAIQKLKVDGKTYIRTAGRKARRGSGQAVQIGQNIPQVMDPETEEELWAELLAHVVEHEWWLLKGEYREMFEEFGPEEDEDADADEEEEEKEEERPNPTPSRGALTPVRTSPDE
ncbi:MAG: hypothetical protein M3P49_10995 [Actinomycetota bacterium]|nr:hypothetical protein [Actinomycetota bacterium]